MRQSLDRIAHRYKPGKQPTDISHAEAKEILFALGVSPALFNEAHRGNVLDAMQNTLAKQAVALPSRFVRFGLTGAFDALSPARPLNDFGGDALALAEHQQDRARQAKGLTYVGQHLRGGAHFALNALANPIDLSTHARGAAANTFAKDGALASQLLDRIREGLAQVEGQLADTTPSPDLERIKRHLARCMVVLQPEVQRFLDAQALAPSGSGRNLESLLRGATELVDTSGKIVIASLLEAAVPGLSRSGLQQLWSLVSYPLMEGVIRAVQNWRDTIRIAKVALGQYLQAKDHLARVSDERLEAIAHYVQAHFEPAEMANHARRLNNVFTPRLTELRTKLAAKQLDFNTNAEKSEARSLQELDLISRRSRLQDKSLVDEGRIHISATDYSVSLEIVDMLTHYFQFSASLERHELDALLDAHVESLMTVYAAPTSTAKEAYARLVGALNQCGVDDANRHLQSLFNAYLARSRATHKLLDGVDVFPPLYLEQPVSSTYTDSGRAKLEVLTHLDQFERNLSIRRGIQQRNASVDALQAQIDHMASYPPRQSLNEQLELADRQRWTSSRIASQRAGLERLKLRVERYAADVEHYKRKDFDSIRKGGEVWQDLLDDNKGAAAAVRRAWKYGFLRTLNNRRSLGLAMAAAYDPTLSGLGARGVFKSPLVNSLAEGFLSPATPVPALTIPVGARYIRAQPPALAHTRRGLSALAEEEPGTAALAEVILPLSDLHPVPSGADQSRGTLPASR